MGVVIIDVERMEQYSIIPIKDLEEKAENELLPAAFRICGRIEKEDYRCEVCGRKISKEEYESCDELCWECWDDQMTEECEFEEDII